MKILIIDPISVGLSFAWRCVTAGHTVRWFSKPTKSVGADSGVGFKGIEKISNWVGSVMWADLVFVTDNSEYTERLDFFKKKGAKICSASAISSKVSLTESGLNVPASKTFASAAEASAHIKKTEQRYVMKAGESTYCSKSAADLLCWLSRSKLEGAVELHDYVDGVGVGVSKWLGGKGWIGAANESIGGESGAVSAFAQDSKLFSDTLSRLEKIMMDMGQLGNVSLDVIVDTEGKCWTVGCDTTPVWPLFDLMLGSIKCDPAEWILDSLSGKDSTSFSTDTGVFLPIKQGEVSDGAPIYGVTKGNKKHLHPQAVKIDVLHDMDGGKIVQRPVWNTTGKAGLVVTGFGKDIKQASERACKTVGQLYFSGMEASAAPLCKAQSSLAALHKFGYATNLNYESKVKQ